MGCGGSDGGDGGGSNGREGLMRFSFFRGLSKLGGGCPIKQDALQRVAVARGLRDVDHLLEIIGKKEKEISLTQALDMVQKESGTDALVDTAMSGLYRHGKGNKPCNQLLDLYKKAREEGNHTRANFRSRDLKKYCGYTDDELKCPK